jgi:hypothetical protein
LDGYPFFGGLDAYGYDDSYDDDYSDGAYPNAEDQAGPPAGPQQQFWYYCDAPKGYYPYVSNCSHNWRHVPSTPPSELQG